MAINLQNHKAKITFGIIAILGLTGMTFYQGNQRLTSQAFINAPVVSLRAPIPGRTSLQSDVTVGLSVNTDQALATISANTENPRISVLRAQISSLHSAKGTLTSELEKINIEISHRKAEYSELEGEIKTQQSADIKGSRSSLAVARADLKRAKLDEQQAKRDLDQASELLASQYISNAAYDKLTDEYGRAQANTAAAGEEVTRARVALEAIQKGVQIGGARTLPYVVTRSRALEEAITDLSARSQYISDRINLITAQISDLENDLAQQSQAILKSPVTGKVWDIISNNGDAVAQQAPVIKVVDCASPWVEAFLDEAETGEIRVGDSVTIEEYFGRKEWQGEVISIRYGTGRVTVGQYMVDPPPEVMRRQLPVRVATAKIGVQWGSDNSMCNVGSSVKVYRSN